MAKVKIKKDDTVIVITGRDRGKTGKVVRVFPDKGKVLVERLNMVKRHHKGTSPQKPGGIIEKEAPIQLSNVMLVCPQTNKPTRVGRKIVAAGKDTKRFKTVRISRKSGEAVERI